MKKEVYSMGNENCHNLVIDYFRRQKKEDYSTDDFDIFDIISDKEDNVKTK